MKKLILFLLLASPCFGQEPILLNSSTTVNSLQCSYALSTTVGSRLIAMAFWKTSTNTPTVADAQGNSYTVQYSDNTGTVKFAIATATASGATTDLTTWTISGATNTTNACMEISPAGISTTVENGTVDNFTSVTSRNTSYTTSTDGDFVVSACYATTAYCTSSSDINVTSGHGTAMGSAFSISGTLGSKTSSWSLTASDSGAVAVVPFKPSAIGIKSPSALPDASTTASYSYQLQEEGATASVTWSITAGALPAGLSLNSSTGEISGTPLYSSSGFTAKADDGTHNASKALTLNVGTSQNTISHLQDATPGSGIFGSNVAANSLILVQTYISPNTTGKFAQCRDTRGTVYRIRDTATEGTQTTAVYSGITPSAGANTVTCTGVGASATIASEFSNAQDAADYNDYLRGKNSNHVQTSGTSLTTPSVTPLNTNSLIYAGWLMVNSVTKTATAPCTSIGTESLMIGCYHVSSSITSYTENITTSGASGLWASFIASSFRPTVPNTAPLPPPNAGQSQIY